MKRKDWISCALIIAVLYTILAVIGIGCPIRWFTGIPCAGCGATRALMALVHLQFHQAFVYYPLIYVFPIVGVGYLLKSYIPKRLRKGMGWGIVILFLGVYVMRFCNPNDPVVRVEVTEGMIYKIFQKLFFRT